MAMDKYSFSKNMKNVLSTNMHFYEFHLPKIYSIYNFYLLTEMKNPKLQLNWLIKDELN